MGEELYTFKNKNGLPIIRNCSNCRHWKPEMEDNNGRTLGYCKAIKLMFASTLEETVYAFTKEFYLCGQHKFKNEEHMEETAEKVSLRDSLKPKGLTT